MYYKAYDQIEEGSKGYCSKGLINCKIVTWSLFEVLELPHL
jgi:hypothetical protein